MSRKEKAYASEEQRWQAVRGRDRQAAEAFVYAVASTGIYCRPGCPSRAPKRENVRFFDDAAQAASAGFRPCLRCLPDQPRPATGCDPRVLAACRAMEKADQPPGLAELARRAGLGQRQFGRLFKECLGVTPKQYAGSLRLARFRSRLAEGGQVTEALYEAGFGSSSRLYEKAGQRLGMAPSALRRGGAGLLISYVFGECFLGPVLVAVCQGGVCAIELGQGREQLRQALAGRFPRAELAQGGPELEGLLQAVLDGIEHPGGLSSLPLHISGTAMQEMVWRALQRIPPGQTVTYGQLAAALGRPNSARAVANAVAANRLAVLVPCHRVVRGDGGLGGYRWGLEKKEALLRREKEEAAG